MQYCFRPRTRHQRPTHPTEEAHIPVVWYIEIWCNIEGYWLHVDHTVDFSTKEKAYDEAYKMGKSDLSRPSWMEGAESTQQPSEEYRFFNHGK